MIDPPIQPVADVDALSQEVRKVAAALLDDAIGRLTDADDVDKAVHETRKRLKELRSMLRLVRGSLVDENGKRIRGRENDRLRSAADALGQSRDAAVMIQTLTALRDGYADALSSEAFEAVRRRLEQRRQTLCDQTRHGMADARQQLEAARRRVETWRIDASDAWSAVAPGLKRIYRRGRRDFQKARKTNDAVLWHDWRKRAKDLRYALELLRGSAPELMAGTRDAVKALTDDVGADHDVHVLVQTLADERLCNEGVLSTITALANSRRSELQARARPEGRRLYAEKPGAFVDRLGVYWNSAT